MGGSNFDLIAQALLQQQKVMEEMEAENRWLRKELADLRAGRGIFLEIEGKRIPLLAAGNSATHMASVSDQPTSTQQAITGAVTVPAPREKAPARQQNTTMPLPAEEEQAVGRAPFLEEIMIDEFSAALNPPSPAIWQGPIQKKVAPKQSEQDDEDELAALRRDLMGSFLLE